jgi:hypothetical protein
LSNRNRGGGEATISTTTIFENDNTTEYDSTALRKHKRALIDSEPMEKAILIGRWTLNYQYEEEYKDDILVVN